MIYSFYCLWHNAIISCNHYDCYVSDLSTAGTHGSKSFMTRSIKESDLAPVLKNNSIGSDMLCNPPCFTCYHIGIPDIIQQLCFTVVNMSHYSNDRRPWFKTVSYTHLR